MNKQEFIDYCYLLGVEHEDRVDLDVVIVTSNDPVIFAFNFITCEGFYAMIEAINLWIQDDTAHDLEKVIQRGSFEYQRAKEKIKLQFPITEDEVIWSGVDPLATITTKNNNHDKERTPSNVYQSRHPNQGIANRSRSTHIRRRSNRRC